MQHELQSPNGLTKFIEGFETLREAASPKVWNAGFHGSQLVLRPSALETVARQLAVETNQQTLPRPPSFDPEEARRQWQRYLASRNPEQLERRVLRHLCWDSEIAVTSAFLHLIGQQDRPPSAPMILGLLGVSHLSWGIPNDELERQVTRWLRSYEGYNPIVRHLSTIADEVVGHDAAWRAARTALENRLATRQLLEERGLAANTPYASAIAAELLNANLQLSERAGELSRARYICEQLVPADRDLIRREAFSNAVKRLIALSSSSTDFALRDVVKSFVLLEPQLGDPRRHSSQWDNMHLSEEARTVTGWLSKEDLEFFFDLIMKGQEDRRERRKFWLRYVSRAKDFCVAIGKTDRERLRTQLQDLKKRGRTYAELDDTYVSAFVMDFGSAIVVDFSLVGACCIYDATPGRKKIGGLRARGFQIRKLKADANHPGRFIHVGSWMHKVQQYLALKYQIRE